MTDYLIRKGMLNGNVTIPPSKSHTLRAILFGALGDGRSMIHHYLPSNDTTAMINACRLFGTTVDVFPDRLEIEGINGNVKMTEDVINAGNSGIILRFCTAVGALAQHPVVVTGDASIRHCRPMHVLLDALNQLGATTTSMRGDGYAPIIVQGPFTNRMATLDGADSQPVSALLIAGAFAPHSIELHVHNAGEKPWVALTLEWLRRLGIAYTNHNFEHYTLQGNSRYQGFEYTVPGDLSTAAFPLAAALVTNSDLILHQVDTNDVQGDKQLFHIFQRMGAKIEIDEAHRTLSVRKGSALSGVSVDINECIDALPILAVVACFAEGDTHIWNGANARNKECDRIACVSQELQKMGAHIEATGDGLIIKGKKVLRGTHVHSHSDHRLAMSLAVAGLGAEGETTVQSVECIGKTFPEFLCAFKALGALIKDV